jgi:DNA-binding response OmpR family regulator
MHMWVPSAEPTAARRVTAIGVMLSDRAICERSLMARLLVVEDEPDVRDLIAMRLLMVGHHVVATADANSALDTVDRIGAPDAYVLDVGLPDIDGFRLLSRLREAGEDAPAIFLSAHVQESEIGLGRAMGARYLTKPFVAKTLLGAVDEAVEGRVPIGATDHGW